MCLMFSDVYWNSCSFLFPSSSSGGSVHILCCSSLFVGQKPFFFKKSSFYLWLSFNFISLDFFSKNFKKKYMKIDMISKSNYYFPFIWSLGGGEALQRRLGREQKLVDGREVREPSTAEPSCEDCMDCVDCMDCILCVHLCYLFLAKRETEMKFRWKNVLPTFPTSPVFLFHQVLSFDTMIRFCIRYLRFRRFDGFGLPSRRLIPSR